MNSPAKLTIERALRRFLEDHQAGELAAINGQMLLIDMIAGDLAAEFSEGAQEAQMRRFAVEWRAFVTARIAGDTAAAARTFGVLQEWAEQYSRR